MQNVRKMLPLTFFLPTCCCGLGDSSFRCLFGCIFCRFCLYPPKWASPKCPSLHFGDGFTIQGPSTRGNPSPKWTYTIILSGDGDGERLRPPARDRSLSPRGGIHPRNGHPRNASLGISGMDSHYRAPPRGGIHPRNGHILLYFPGTGMESGSARPPVIGVYEGKEFAPGRGVGQTPVGQIHLPVRPSFALLGRGEGAGPLRPPPQVL